MVGAESLQELKKVGHVFCDFARIIQRKGIGVTGLPNLDCFFQKLSAEIGHFKNNSIGF
jgi:hypothetical protein